MICSQGTHMHTQNKAGMEVQGLSKGKIHDPKTRCKRQHTRINVGGRPFLGRKERESIHMKGWHSVHRIPSPIDPNSFAWHWVQNHKKSTSKQDQEVGEVGSLRCVQPLFPRFLAVNPGYNRWIFQPETSDPSTCQAHQGKAHGPSTAFQALQLRGLRSLGPAGRWLAEGYHYH